MPLTPKESNSGDGSAIFPITIAQSAIIESAISSTGTVAENATISLGWKPTASTITPLIDVTGHYLLTVRKQEDALTVWKQGTQLDALSYATVGGATYAQLLQNVLTALAGSYYGYFSRVAVVEQALDYSAFVQPSAVVTGLWTPSRLTGFTVHTLLEFGDAANLGQDTSGNGNHWTITGTLTADTPTNNYATLNPLVPGTSNHALSEGSTRAQRVITGTSHVFSTYAGVGKVYFEATPTGTVSVNTRIGITASNLAYNGNVYYNSTGATQNVGITFGSGDTIGVALDADNETIRFSVNGVWSDTTVSFLGLIPTNIKRLNPRATTDSNGFVWSFEFGSRGFQYSPPDDSFHALCSANMTDPLTLKSSTVADTVLREGTGEVASVNSLEFAPDFLLAKNRDGTFHWQVHDTVRGAGNYLLPSSTDGQVYNTATVSSFDSNGVTLGNSSINASGDSIIDLYLQRSAESGFDVVTYTGNGIAGRTVPHGLGKPPEFMIIKRTTSVGSWLIYHSALGATKYMLLTTETAGTSVTPWNNTEPTATEFTLGESTTVNAAGDEFVAYLFTESDIFKPFFYTGNGAVDGPFINFGGRPKIVLLKNTAGNSGSWLFYSAATEQANPVDTQLLLNAYNAETDFELDALFTADGLKLINTKNASNESGCLIVGLAILESTNHANAY